MRDYGKVTPQFWIGETGRMLRGNPKAQVLAMYLLTCPTSEMTGVFYCPLTAMAHETGLDLEAPSKPLRSPFVGVNNALKALEQAGFCEFDEKSEYVFVFNMARYQIGATLKETDNQVKGIKKQVESMPKCFRLKFLERYNSDYCLHLDDEISKLKASSSEAPCKPLRSQEQEQEQEQDISSSLSPQQAVGTTGSEKVVLPKQDKTPTKRIVDLYNEQFNGKLPLVRETTDKRRTLVRGIYNKLFKRCKCENEDEGILAIKEYLDAVESSDWLMGRNPKSNGWRADFDFIFSERCFVGMLEGKYARR